MERRLNTNLVGYASQLGDGIGCLQIRNLDTSKTAERVRLLIEDLGQIRGLVIDLRDTYGNNFQTGLEVVPLFLRSGIVWRCHRKAGSGTSQALIRLTENCLQWEAARAGSLARHSRWQRQPFLTPGVATIVLINQRTGTAGGVVALALKDNTNAGIWGAAATLSDVPADYFAVNSSGQLLRIASSNSQTVSGQMLADKLNSKVECEPHSPFETDSFDERLILRAKETIVNCLAEYHHQHGKEAT